MISNAAYTLIFGKPLIFWMGLVVFSFLVASVISGLMVIRGKLKFKYHRAVAFTTLAIGIMHGMLGMLFYL